jgi:hypothetical protein
MWGELTAGCMLAASHTLSRLAQCLCDLIMLGCRVDSRDMMGVARLDTYWRAERDMYMRLLTFGSHPALCERRCFLGGKGEREYVNHLTPDFI